MGKSYSEDLPFCNGGNSKRRRDVSYISYTLVLHTNCAKRDLELGNAFIVSTQKAHLYSLKLLCRLFINNKREFYLRC